MIELIKYNGTPLEVCGLRYWKALAKDKANAVCFLFFFQCFWILEVQKNPHQEE